MSDCRNWLIARIGKKSHGMVPGREFDNHQPLGLPLAFLALGIAAPYPIMAAVFFDESRYLANVFHELFRIMDGDVSDKIGRQGVTSW